MGVDVDNPSPARFGSIRKEKGESAYNRGGLIGAHTCQSRRSYSNHSSIGAMTMNCVIPTKMRFSHTCIIIHTGRIAYRTIFSCHITGWRLWRTTPSKTASRLFGQARPGISDSDAPRSASRSSGVPA